jgi:hypothetical protein
VVDPRVTLAIVKLNLIKTIVYEKKKKRWLCSETERSKDQVNQRSKMTDPIPVMPTTGGGRGSEQYGNNVKS